MPVVACMDLYLCYFVGYAATCILLCLSTGKLQTLEDELNDLLDLYTSTLTLSEEGDVAAIDQLPALRSKVTVQRLGFNEMQNQYKVHAYSACKYIYTSVDRDCAYICLTASIHDI